MIDEDLEAFLRENGGTWSDYPNVVVGPQNIPGFPTIGLPGSKPANILSVTCGNDAMPLLTARGKQQLANDGLRLVCGGPDKVGKTEILKALSAATCVAYFKAGCEHSVFTKDQSQFLLNLRHFDVHFADFVKQARPSFVSDRGYCCEWVYSRFFGRETDAAALAAADASHAEAGTKVLVCMRKRYTEEMRDDLDPKIGPLQMAQLGGLYMEFLKWTKCSTHVLYTDSHDLRAQVCEALDWLGLEHKR
jgi:hypothetical protein